MRAIEPTAFWSRGNRALCVATFAMCVAATALWLGPGATYRRQLEAELETQSRAFERLQAEFRSYRPITEFERQQWQHRMVELSRWLPEADDEPTRMAHVARWLEAPSTRELQVQPGDPLEAREIGVESTMTLRSPDDEVRLRVVALPLQIGFKISYADLRDLLRRIQDEEVPILIEALRVRRAFDELDVRMDTVALVRTGGGT